MVILGELDSCLVRKIKDFLGSNLPGKIALDENHSVRPAACSMPPAKNVATPSWQKGLNFVARAASSTANTSPSPPPLQCPPCLTHHADRNAAFGSWDPPDSECTTSASGDASSACRPRKRKKRGEKTRNHFTDKMIGKYNGKNEKLFNPVV